MAKCRCSNLPVVHERDTSCLTPETDRSVVAAAAARVRKALGKHIGGKVVVLDHDDGEALAPNQLLHQMLGMIDEEPKDVEVAVVVYRGHDGVWMTDWSRAKPAELLEAATALKLDAEVAWCEIQEQVEDDLSPDE